MIRVAHVGCGAWGRNLARNISDADRTELVAICDPNPDARRSIRQARDAKEYASFRDMLDAGGFDAVVIASPSGEHFEQALAALSADLHVFVEKPMCKTGAEGEALVALARERNRVLMVGHTFLYSNLVHEVKRRIDSGELGEILYIYSQRLNLGRVRSDVDALWNFAPHDISITCFLMNGWPHAVSARGASFIQRRDNIADVAFFQLDFDRERMMAGHVSWLSPQKVRKMVIVGSEKMLVYDDIDSAQHIQIYDKSVALEFQAGSEDFSDFRTRVRAGDLVVPNVRLVEPLGVEIDHFGQCIEEGITPRTDGEHGLNVVRILEAMSKSMAAQGNTQHVEYGRGEVVASSIAGIAHSTGDPSGVSKDAAEQTSGGKPAVVCLPK